MDRRFLIMFIFFPLLLSAQPQALKLVELYGKRDYTQLYSYADSLLRLDSNCVEAHLYKGRGLTDQGRLREALPYLNKSALLDTINGGARAWAYGYMARIAFSTEGKEQARVLLEKALALNAGKNINNFIRDRLLIWGMESFYNEWDLRESANLRFYFAPDLAGMDKDRFITSRENAFNEIAAAFSYTSGKKITVYVWSSDSTAKLRGIRSLGFALPEMNIVHTRANQTPGHELAHVIIFNSISCAKSTRLINEGAAVYYNCNKNDYPRMIAESRSSSKDAGAVSIKDAWTDPRKSSEWVYYTGGGLLINNLLQAGGFNKLKMLLADQSYDSARRIYGEDIDRIIAQTEKQLNP